LANKLSLGRAFRLGRLKEKLCDIQMYAAFLFEKNHFELLAYTCMSTLNNESIITRLWHTGVCHFAYEDLIF